MTIPSTDPQRLAAPYQVPDGVDFSIDDCKHPCRTCGKSIPYNSALQSLGWGAGLVCDPCFASRDRDTKTERINIVSPQGEIERLIPPLYRDTDPERLPYAERQTVLQWTPGRSRGLWIHGETRRGKTRTMCLLLEKMIREGKKVRAFFHGSFGVDLVEVMRSERSFRAWKWEITRADVLVIDDLFADKITERIETAIFEIFDERISFNRPTIVTTQVTKNIAKKRFHSEPRCDAFFARIKEFFQGVQFTKDLQTELEEVAA